MTTTLMLGDCLARMAEIEAGSVDAVVTDPPYGLKFMGKAWDHGVPGVPFWSAMLRTMKPGGYLLAFGGTRTFHRQVCAIEDAGFEVRDCLMWMYGQGFPKAKSCLKPGWEPITLARKPGGKVLPLWIDACGIIAPGGLTSGGRCVGSSPNPMNRAGRISENRDRSEEHALGRWPANVVLDAEAAAMLDEQSGTLTSGFLKPNQPRVASIGKGGYGDDFPDTCSLDGSYGDSGGASRFFYCAKASRKDRGEGNNHPTVKPHDLMRWLVRMVAKLGETVADYFMGSGSTGKACVAEGVNFIGCDKSPEYLAIAEKRIAAAQHATPLLTG